MPEWGKRQRLLKKARVACIGSGGVKSSLLMALAAAGIGNIKIIEFDKVELSNLNRQTLFNTEDVGKNKGECAARLMKKMNPKINIAWINEKIMPENIHRLLKDSEFIVEGGESPAGRNIVNEYCLETGKPMVHASAQFGYGYVFSVLPEKKTACFACLFPDDYTREKHTGAVPVWVCPVQIAGSLGAVEVLKYFLGYKNNMVVNKQLVFSSLLLSEQFEYLDVPRNKKCPVCSKYYK
jgi:adenylyltransferase/sulfurtransferase